MTILRDIRAAELVRQSYKVALEKMQAEVKALEGILEAERQQLSVDLKNKVVLDLSKDVDPYGYHGISLVDRLRAMGWPE